MKGITYSIARIVCRVIVEAVARTRCGEDLKGLATHCGVSIDERNSILRAAKDEGLIDSLFRYVERQ